MRISDTMRGRLAGRHALGLDNGHGDGRGQKIDECLSRFRLLAVGGDGSRENQFLLQFGREDADKIDAGRDQHVDQEHPELGLAVGDAGAIWAGMACGLVLAFIASAMPSRSNTFGT